MSENFIKKVFMSNNYFVLTKSICEIIDPNSAVLLSLLIDKYFYWKDTGKLGADGSFYKDRNEIQNEISLTRKKRESAQRTLIHFGFLEISKTNPAGYNYYVINWENLQEAWTDPEKYKSQFHVETEDDTPCAQNVPNDLGHETCSSLGTNRAEAWARNVPITKNSERRTQNENASANFSPREDVSESKKHEVVGEVVEKVVGGLTLRHAIMAVKIDGMPIPDEYSLGVAVQMCMDAGVPLNDMSTSELVNICFPRELVATMRKKRKANGDKIKIDEWQEMLCNQFEKLVAQIYLAGTVESTVVKKAQVPEPDVKLRDGDLFISPEIAKFILDLPEDDISVMDLNLEDDDDYDTAELG